MSLEGQAWPNPEAQFIASLRARYENEGFTFTPQPSGPQLPDFLGSYRPDAIAEKAGRTDVIEVRRRRSLASEPSLDKLRRLLEGHPGWRLHVVFMGEDPLRSVTIPAFTTGPIRSGIADVRRLAAQGHRRAAFVMAWSLLEASLRLLIGETAGHPRAAGTVVQTLAMRGALEPEQERRIQALVEVRNRIVHGDLELDVAMSDVELIVSAVEATAEREPFDKVIPMEAPPD